MERISKVSTSSISRFKFKACLFTQPTYNLWLWAGPPTHPMNREETGSARIIRTKNWVLNFESESMQSEIQMQTFVKTYKWDIIIQYFISDWKSRNATFIERYPIHGIWLLNKDWHSLFITQVSGDCIWNSKDITHSSGFKPIRKITRLSPTEGNKIWHTKMIYVPLVELTNPYQLNDAVFKTQKQQFNVKCSWNPMNPHK